MKSILSHVGLLIWLLFSSSMSLAQDVSPPSRWQGAIAFGSYSASLAVPRFDPFHPQVQLQARYQWKERPHSRWVQSSHLGYLFHRHLQHGLQLHTNIAWERSWDNGLWIMPLQIGGGYMMSVVDMETFRWDPDQQQYIRRNSAFRHQGMLVLGSSIGYQTPWQLAGRPIGFFLAYQLHVIGPFVRETVPILAYSPLSVGIDFSLSPSTSNTP